jgi:alpha-beta hydrolase superfamily lysophospholipase
MVASTLSRRAGLAATLVAVILAVLSSPVAADTHQRGPDPTTASISAPTGPFGTTSKTVPGNGQFGKLTVHYPTATPEGTYGVVAIIPGFTMPWSQIAWLGPRLASQGFVVIGIDTVSPYDRPERRATEFVAAINAEKADPALSGIADFDRTALAGWSMGGGGALDAATTAKYKAIIGIAPWEDQNTFSTVTSPTLIIGGQSDKLAPVGSMSKPFYNAVNAAKAYAELAGANHFFTTSANVPQAASMICWLKRYVDNDTRYTRFLVPGPPVASGFSAYQSNDVD